MDNIRFCPDSEFTARVFAEMGVGEPDLQELGYVSQIVVETEKRDAHPRQLRLLVGKKKLLRLHKRSRHYGRRSKVKFALKE